MKEAIAFHEVTFRYGDRDLPALENVNVAIPEGTFALVCGGTGSGKSTLLRAVNGLVPHFTGGVFSGRVTVEQRDTVACAPRDLADVVAFVPQDPGATFVVDRVEDELAYAMENLGVEAATMRRRVEETLDLLDIEHLRTRSVRTLSGGERQRVAIAAALTPGAKVVLLDEPTSQLDPQGAEGVLAALQRLVHDLGLTVVVAEHRLDRVADFADMAVGCLGRGRVAAGEPAEILELLETGPPVSRLGRLLGWHPLPLTVRQARRMMQERDMHLPAFVPPPPPAPRSPVLVAERLGASYEDKVAIADVSLSLSEGEVVALMGRNGSGKSTLLRTVAGARRPDTGRVTVRGHPPRLGTDVALCPQTPEDILFAETVGEEVRATLDAHRRNESVDVLLEQLGIPHQSARHPRDLSAGERLLVAVASVVAAGAEVLLLDEPTRGLDAATKDRLSGFLRSYAARGHAVMFASHDVELVAGVADRVVMLAGGELIADSTPAEVLGDSAAFAPQTARVFGREWLTPEQLYAAVIR